MKWNGYIYFPACFCCSVWQHIEKVIEVVWLCKIKFYFTQFNGGLYISSVMCCGVDGGNNILFESNIIPYKPKFDRSWQSFNVNGSWYDDNVPCTSKLQNSIKNTVMFVILFAISKTNIDLFFHQILIEAFFIIF